MSERIPGYDQKMMIAVWSEFVKKTFKRTRFLTKVNGKERIVYQDGTKRLLVLDEYHGDLEILEFQDQAGSAKHTGTQEIEVDYEQKAGSSQVTVKAVKLGKVKGGAKHKFLLTGSLK